AGAATARARLRLDAPLMTSRRSHSIPVVDGEKPSAAGRRRTCEGEGYSVRTAGSVREALGAVAQSEPHAAVVDLMLPDGDGVHLTRALKRRDAAMEILIIT